MPIDKVPKGEDILARSSLLKELGARCLGEAIYDGIQPIYKIDKLLTQDEQAVLCLKLWPRQEKDLIR